MKYFKSKFSRVLIGISLAIVIGIIACITVICNTFSGMQTKDITKSDEALNVDTTLSDGKIINIALFGIDEGVTGQPKGIRSDAIIILTIDKKNETLKLTSILRDSLVEIDGYGKQNLNQAYKFGGPELAIKTINKNFDMDIKDYITVNFSQLKSFVNAVGGVSIDLRPEELAEINASSPNSPYLESAGQTTLTGEQALAYSRIRSKGTDVARSHRQQYVLNALIQKIKAMPKSQYPMVIKEFLPMIETSLNYNDFISFTPFITQNFSIEENIIPLKKYETDLWGGLITPSCWSWTYDLENATKRLHHIIYNTEYNPPKSMDKIDDSSEIFKQMYDEDAECITN